MDNADSKYKNGRFIIVANIVRYFSPLRCTFAYMFENLQNRLEKAFKNLKGQGKINELNVAETVKEIRRALISADVNFKVAKTFTDDILEKAKGEEVLKSVSPGQMLTKIVHDELVNLLGGTKSDLQLNGNPAVILPIAHCTAARNNEP